MSVNSPEISEVQLMHFSLTPLSLKVCASNTALEFSPLWHHKGWSGLSLSLSQVSPAVSLKKAVNTGLSVLLLADGCNLLDHSGRTSAPLELVCWFGRCVLTAGELLSITRTRFTLHRWQYNTRLSSSSSGRAAAKQSRAYHSLLDPHTSPELLGDCWSKGGAYGSLGKKSGY